MAEIHRILQDLSKCLGNKVSFFLNSLLSNHSLHTIVAIVESTHHQCPFNKQSWIVSFFCLKNDHWISIHSQNQIFFKVCQRFSIPLFKSWHLSDWDFSKDTLCPSDRIKNISPSRFLKSSTCFLNITTDRNWIFLVLLNIIEDNRSYRKLTSNRFNFIRRKLTIFIFFLKISDCLSDQFFHI